MKKIIIALFIIYSTVLNAEIQLISSPSCGIAKLTENDLNQLYFKKRTELFQQKIVVLDRSENHLYNEFNRKILGKTSAQVKVYWSRMIFTGMRKPPEKVDIQELKNLNTNDGVCYLTYTDLSFIPNKWISVEPITQ